MNEITTIALKANRELETAYNTIENKSLDIFESYPKSVYNAGLNNSHILVLNPTELGQISSFYEVQVSMVNSLLERDERLRVEYQDNWERCLFQVDNGLKENCDVEKALLEEASVYYASNRSLGAEQLGLSAFERLKLLILQISDLNHQF